MRASAERPRHAPIDKPVSAGITSAHASSFASAAFHPDPCGRRACVPHCRHDYHHDHYPGRRIGVRARL